MVLVGPHVGWDVSRGGDSSLRTLPRLSTSKAPAASPRTPPERLGRRSITALQLSQGGFGRFYQLRVKIDVPSMAVEPTTPLAPFGLRVRHKAGRLTARRWASVVMVAACKR